MDPMNAKSKKKKKVKKTKEAVDAAATSKPKDFNDDTPVTVEDLRELKLKQLKKIAKDRKISYNKSDIVEKEDMVQVLVTSGKINMQQERKASFAARFFGGGDGSKKNTEESVLTTKGQQAAAKEEQPWDTDEDHQQEAREEKGSLFEMNRKKWIILGVVASVIIAAVVIIVAVVISGGGGDSSSSSNSASAGGGAATPTSAPVPGDDIFTGDDDDDNTDDTNNTAQPTMAPNPSPSNPSNPSQPSPTPPSPSPPNPTPPSPSPPTSQPTTAQPTVSIVLVNMGTTNNADYDAVLRQAADRWEEVLVSVSGNGSYLPGDDWFNDYFAPASQDPGTLPVEDQAVVIGYDFISDPIVGRGTPTKPRRSGGRPIATRSGWMEFGANIFNGMPEEQRFFTAMHEIGHVLGIGTIVQTDCWSQTCVEDNALEYPCQKAKDAFSALGISSDPLKVDGNPGSACSHWDETLFNGLSWSDVMTPSYNGQPQLLTSFDIAALDDLGGYTVNYAAADAIPSSRRSLRGVA